MADALQGVVLALQRHQDAVGRHQRVQGEQAERGRAVDQHIVVACRVPAEGVGKPVFPARRLDQLDLGAGQMHRGRREVEVRHLRFGNDLRQRGGADDQIVGVRLPGAGRRPQAGGRVGLGIEIQQQHPQAAGGQRRAEIDRRGRLADAAFLVGDRQDARRPVRGAGEAAGPAFLIFRSICRQGVRFQHGRSLQGSARTRPDAWRCRFAQRSFSNL